MEWLLLICNMNLFDDQNLLTYGIAKALQRVRKLAIQLATGGGKTVIFSNISSRWWRKNNTSVVIFVHREKLLEQTRKTLWFEFGIEAVSVVAGMKYIPSAPIYVCMVESAFKRLSKLHNVGLVIIDECHRGEFNKLHAEFETVKILGFTATPLAASPKRPLNLYYEEIIVGPQIKELIKLGRLSQLITYEAKTKVSEEDLVVKGNDFDEEKMATVYRKGKHIAGTINAYVDRGVGLKTVIYNSNIQHSLDVTKAFNDAGYECRHLGYDIGKQAQKEVFKWLETNPHAIVSNVDIATTGIDEPTIEHIILNRDTLSLTLYLQMLGRGGRITNLKSMFWATDMGSNWKRFGEWGDDRDWADIFNNPPKPNPKLGVAAVKSCINCGALIPTPSHVCPYCDFVFPARVIPEAEIINEFVMVTKNINPAEIIAENKNRKEYSTLFEIGRRVAISFKEKRLEINENNFNLCLQIYSKLAAQWTKERGKKYNEFHRDLVKKTLINELQIHYPGWQSKAV